MLVASKGFLQSPQDEVHPGVAILPWCRVISPGEHGFGPLAGHWVLELWEAGIAVAKLQPGS